MKQNLTFSERAYEGIITLFAMPIVCIIGWSVLDKILYEHLIAEGREAEAWSIRPIHGFKRFWFGSKEAKP